MSEGNQLTKPQIISLRNCEAIIERGQRTFVEVGTALLQIKQEKLYLRDYESFPEYCHGRWGFEKNYANKLIASAKVVDNIIGAGTTVPTLPTTESQARPLAAVPPEQQAEAWQEVVDTCEERDVPITAAVVEEVAAAYVPEKPKITAPEREPDPEPEIDEDEDPEEHNPAADDFCGTMNEALENALRDFDPPTALVVVWFENKILQFK